MRLASFAGFSFGGTATDTTRGLESEPPTPAATPRTTPKEGMGADELGEAGVGDGAGDRRAREVGEGGAGEHGALLALGEAERLVREK